MPYSIAAFMEDYSLVLVRVNDGPNKDEYTQYAVENATNDFTKKRPGHELRGVHVIVGEPDMGHFDSAIKSALYLNVKRVYVYYEDVFAKCEDWEEFLWECARYDLTVWSLDNDEHLNDFEDVPSVLKDAKPKSGDQHEAR